MFSPSDERSLRRTRAVALVAMVSALPSAPRAQAAPTSEASADGPAASTLPVVQVKAAIDAETAKGPVIGYAAKRSATATKTDTPLNEVPQSITVITSDQIRDQNAQTMQEALRYTAGARSEMYGLDNRGDWFTLRGGSEGSTLLDGLRLVPSSGYGVMRNEPYAFERIEVLRGPTSVIAGQNGPGGVVNLVSKRPQAEAAREVEVQLGNRDHRQIDMDLTGPLTADGSLLYRLVALRKDSNTQVDHAYDDRRLFAPSFTWKPQAGTSLTLYGEYQKDQSGNTNAFLGYEGTLLPAPNGRISPSLFIGEPDWDRYGGERYRFGYEFEQQLGDRWTLRHNLRHDDVDGGQRSMYAAWYLGFSDSTGAPDPNGTHLNRVWYGSDNKGRATNTDLLLEGKLDWGPTRHTVLFGVDVMKSTGRERFADGDATPLDVYNPVYGTFPEPAIGNDDYTSTRIRDIGVLVQDQIKFDDRFVLVAGLRRDQAKTGATGTPSKTVSATSKNIGLVYLTDGGWSPYASHSESFEPVASTDKSDKPFAPKRGKQIEAGLKWSPANQRVTASASVYRLEEKNRLAPDPTDPNFSVQRGEVTVKGAELEIAANLPAWDLIANYTYARAQVTRTTPDDIASKGAQLNSIPEHSASGWAVHRLGVYGLPGWRVGGGVRYVGKTWDGTDTVSVPSYTVTDLLLAYERTEWRFALNVTNLFDKTYLATCLTRGDCWFGTRRRAVASVSYRW